MIGQPGSPRRVHLVSVWNPSCAHDAMEEHLAVLLGLAKKLDATSLAPDSNVRG